MNKLRENHIVFKNLNQYDLKIFNNVFKSNILKFNKIIDSVASYHKNDLLWLSQTTLSRNNYLSNIHFVNEKLDSGKLIVQKIFFIKKDDKVDILRKKTQKLEHKAFSEAIIKIYRYN